MSATFVSATQIARIATAALAGWAMLSHTAHATGSSPNVGISVSVSQPGFYGRVNIGDQAPTVIYPQPIIIQQQPVAVHQRPIYLRVPPSHSRAWARHCGYYRACGQPVYFVQDEPRRGDRDRDDRRDWDRHDHDRHDHDRGNKHDKKHGRGHGHDHHRD